MLSETSARLLEIIDDWKTWHLVMGHVPSRTHTNKKSKCPAGRFIVFQTEKTRM
jgi:hypothetical protein